MNVITEPHVHLLAEPIFHPHPAYDIPSYNTAAEAITAHAGKGCYDSYGSDGRSVEEHILALIESLHGSVLEHANFTVFITGVSRGLSHELVRHRAGFAYSQRSTRYTAEGDASIVLSPFYSVLKKKGFDNCTNTERALLEGFLNQCAQAIAEYGRQIELLELLAPEGMKGRDLRKWCRGQARQVMPHALETRLTVTGNIRAWRHFFEQRSSRWAEGEIRRLASHVWEAIAPAIGYPLEDYTAVRIDGIDEFTTHHRKV